MTPLNTDDHYIPDANNAHLDLSDFSAELNSFVAQNHVQGIDESIIVGQIYSKVLHRLCKEIAEPDDDDLVCRYLTVQKFLWFCVLKSLHFSNPTDFDDPKECQIAEDYDAAVYLVLAKNSISSSQWESCSIAKAQEWLVSCWTKLDDSYDNNLLWHKYAGGPNGVAITVRYGDLKTLLKNKFVTQARGDRLFCGFVDYGTRNCFPPFSKRRIFRNEKEVRFAFRHSQCLSGDQVDISDCTSIFGVRFALDAAPYHVDAAKTLWLKCGWPDRIVCP